MSNEIKTHIQHDSSWPTEPQHKASNILGDVGSVEVWDFSLANSSYEARVYFVSKVASICYGNPKALGSISLFNRLQAEAAGLPSSSYEFVPVLLSMPFPEGMTTMSSVLRYGQPIIHNRQPYYLTNLRALIADVGPEESLNYFNTSPEEIDIIRANFKVFLFNVDLATRAQMVRHRCSWQELSRRYVSGSKTPFQFYVSPKMATLEVDAPFDDSTIPDVIDICVRAYDAAISSGIKPEEARRILPQAMMTTIWGAFLPYQLDNFLTLRLDSHAQREIRLVAEAMKESL